jgi:hypothetical protein
MGFQYLYMGGMKKTGFLVLLLLVGAASAECVDNLEECFDFAVTNSTGGDVFDLGDSFFVSPVLDFSGTLEIEILTEDDNWFFTDTYRSVNGSPYSFNSKISDPTGDWMFTLSVPGTNVSVSKTVRTVLNSSNAYYGINFNSPVQTLPYYRGESIIISVEVFRGVEKITGALVKAWVGSDELFLAEVGYGVYSGTYDLKTDSSDAYKLVRVTAEKPLTQGVRSGGEYLNLEVKPSRINLSLSELSSDVFNPGDEVALVIVAYYPDGSLMRNADASVLTPSGSVRMNWLGEVYAVNYTIPKSFTGAWNARFTVADDYGNSGELQRSILVRVPPLITHPLVILVGVFLFLIFILFFAFGGTRLVRSYMLNYYLSKQKDLKRMQEITQKKYFNRMIDEETYMELMRKHEAQLVNVQTSIKELRKTLGIKKEGKKSGKK